ncbi:hypothetical protein BCR32DRAFT_292057 [Anaeromyces robustus]|uniref:RNI-like protein n=1 Tax=Anaeromyces robustus TaxID=1754192 RepID=A0A1Y1XC71_9FUNG|nr:hypothetical protein BCR32DRAFT_292057 [Anaeromyces robustus]|eukprot:ORX83317.1 hypothetical protein BCR32DRAFT_292057 [Anaeromyces robustus]
MNNIKYSKYSRINPFRDISFRAEKYVPLFNSEKINKNEKVKIDLNYSKKSLFDICLIKCSKLTDRIDFYSIPYHIGKRIILKAKELQQIVSLETIQHISYVYEDEIQDFPYFLKQLRIWNRSLSYEQFLGLNNLSKVLTHLDLKLADINNNTIVFLNCLINLVFLDLSLNPNLSDYGISKMLVKYYSNDDKEEEDNSRVCYENLQMLNLSYNSLITDQFMYRYCDKFKSLRVLEVSNTNISSLGISYFLKQQKNKWGLLESDYPLFDEYYDNSHLNPFEDYYNNSYNTYHKNKNNLDNPLSNMIAKPVKPIKIDIENLKFNKHYEEVINENDKLEKKNELVKENNLNENQIEEEDTDEEESLLYNSVFRGKECHIEDRPSFNWHKNRKIIKQNTINYTWKLFRKIPLNSGVIKFNNNHIITVQLENNNNNKRNINTIEKNGNNKVVFKKLKKKDDISNSIINDISH